MDEAIKKECDVFWNNLQTILLSVLAPIVPEDRPSLYLDYPVHRNIGDLAIYLGTRKWLSDNYPNNPDCWNAGNFRFPSLPENAVILLHGGGNFGDLYPLHQQFREAVIQAYPENRIVILPQTIYFSNLDTLSDAAKVLNAHQDLHLLVRDNNSLAIATSAFVNAAIHLAPDMASFLFPLSFEQSRPVAGRRIYLLRRDKEALATESARSAHQPGSVDWVDLLGGYGWPMRAMQFANAAAGGHLPAQAFERHWHEMAKKAVNRTLCTLQSADSIVTSRLHGHILASLLGIQNTLLNNSYGKNHHYFETWSSSLSFARIRLNDG